MTLISLNNLLITKSTITKSIIMILIPNTIQIINNLTINIKTNQSKANHIKKMININQSNKDLKKWIKKE